MPAAVAIPAVTVSPPVQSQASAPTKPNVSIPLAKIIEQARALDKRIAESNKPKPIAESLKTPLITKAEVEQTRAALRSIGSTEPEYAEAQKLLASLDRREEEGKRAMDAAIAKAKADDVEGRKAYAKELERNYLFAGYDITISVSGARGTTLSLRYVLFNRPLVYKLTTDANGKETDFLDNCRQRGFTKVVFTDGYDKTWTVSLQSPGKPADAPSPKPTTPKPPQNQPSTPPSLR